MTTDPAAPAKERAKRLPADERRVHILDAARRVFERFGFAAARTRTISEEAGVNEALLYRHFPSKEALFDAAVAEPLEESVERLLELSRKGDAFTERNQLRAEHMEELMRELLSGMVAAGPLLGMVLMADPQRGQTYYEEQFSPAMRRLVEAIEAVEEVWHHRDVPADLVLHWAVGACLMMAIDQRFGGHLLDDHDEVVRQLTAFMLAALGNEAGSESAA